MRNILALIFLFIPISTFSQYATEKLDRYLFQYQQLAIDEMHKYNVPASIKLAQAIYATEAGSNELFSQANNHFGILCPSGYIGEKYDRNTAEGEVCYVKYSNPQESYRAHSLFLTEKQRYAFLFTLPLTDYRHWAKGLQEAGYSGNPLYADRLIEIIEKYELYLLDLSAEKREENIQSDLKGDDSHKKTIEKESHIAGFFQNNIPETKKVVYTDTVRYIVADTLTHGDINRILNQNGINGDVVQNSTLARETYIESGIEVIIEKKSAPVISMKDSIQKDIIREVIEPALIFKAAEWEYRPVPYSRISRKVFMNNKVRFIIARASDTYKKISEELGINEKDLRQFNDLYEDLAEPEEGEVIYLQRKNIKSNVYAHMIRKGESLRYIAQKYAITLETLFKQNDYAAGKFRVGSVICIDCKQ